MNTRLIPTVIQDYKTLKVYMLGFSNSDSLDKTQKTGWVYFWSRSKKRLWMKGEKSGNKLKAIEIYFDCDDDSLLIKAKLIGKFVCHTNNVSCFTKRITNYDT